MNFSAAMETLKSIAIVGHGGEDEEGEWITGSGREWKGRVIERGSGGTEKGEWIKVAVGHGRSSAMKTQKK